jgi:hypothetical protein
VHLIAIPGMLGSSNGASPNLEAYHKPHNHHGPTTPQLSRQPTCSKVITYTQGLQISRDTYTALTSVRELIEKLDVEPHAVICIINGWHHATFKAMEHRLRKRLLQLTPPVHSKPRVSPVIEIEDTPPRTSSNRKSTPSSKDTRNNWLGALKLSVNLPPWANVQKTI